MSSILDKIYERMEENINIDSKPVEVEKIKNETPPLVMFESKDCQNCYYFGKGCKHIECYTGEGKEMKFYIFKTITE